MLADVTEPTQVKKDETDGIASFFAVLRLAGEGQLFYELNLSPSHTLYD